MPISFSQIPANIKVPLYWVEVDPSKAGLPVLKQPALLVGTMIAPGDATPDIPIAIGSQAQADGRSEEHTSELQSLRQLVCRLLLGKKKRKCPRRKSPRGTVEVDRMQ